MNDPAREQLLGHLFGALDPTEEETLAARLKSDPELRRELASLRESLEPVLAARDELAFDPPAGLAAQTCATVDSHRSQPRSVADAPATSPAKGRKRGRIRPLEGEVPASKWTSQLRLTDIVVAGIVFVAAFGLIGPALHNSRENARILGCQDNLRDVGQGLKQYSARHSGMFPAVPTKGPYGVAGIYAPTLGQENLLRNASRVVCPGSTLADEKNFRIPTLADLRKTSPAELKRLQPRLGGSYGYSLGYKHNDRYQPTRDLGRRHYAVMADAPSNLPGLQSLNHGGRGQNVWYEDGHVRFLTVSKPYDQADDIYANDDGQVAAGLHRDDSVVGASTARPIVVVLHLKPSARRPAESQPVAPR